ncbi:MAG: hypothetical protein ACRC33_04980, partial [Gemmataceae bacterium]
MLSANPAAVRTRTVALVGGGDALNARAAFWRGQGRHVRPAVVAGPRNVLDVPAADASEAARQALAGYDRVEFAARGGLGFRAIQAKRAGVAFEDTTLAVVPDDGPRERRLPASLVELVGGHAER